MFVLEVVTYSSCYRHSLTCATHLFERVDLRPTSFLLETGAWHGGTPILYALRNSFASRRDRSYHDAHRIRNIEQLCACIDNFIHAFEDFRSQSTLKGCLPAFRLPVSYTQPAGSSRVNVTPRYAYCIRALGKLGR